MIQPGSMAFQDLIATASLAVAIAVPLSGAIVAWLRHRDRSADGIRIEAWDQGDGLWAARICVTGLPGTPATKRC